MSSLFQYMTKVLSFWCILPSVPSALTGISCARLFTVCLFACPFRTTTLPFQLFKDFIYRRPGIWWDDKQYHEADRYSKWPCKFCAFHPRRFEFSYDRIGPSLRDDVTTITLEGLQLSAWHLVEWFPVPWSRLLLQMARIGYFLRDPRNLYFLRFGNVGRSVMSVLPFSECIV